MAFVLFQDFFLRYPTGDPAIEARSHLIRFMKQEIALLEAAAEDGSPLAARRRLLLNDLNHLLNEYGDTGPDQNSA